jgi:hypothetical protein
MGGSQRRKRVGGKIDCTKVYLDHARRPRKLSTRIAKFFCDKLETERGVGPTVAEREDRIERSVLARQRWEKIASDMRSQRTFRGKFVRAWKWLRDGEGDPSRDVVEASMRRRESTPRGVLERLYENHKKGKGQDRPDGLIRMHGYRRLKGEQERGVELNREEQKFMDDYERNMDVIERAPADYLYRVKKR